MASNGREEFSMQVDAKMLVAVRCVAEKEGRQLQSVIEEALTDLLEKRRLVQTYDSHVLTAYERSHEQYSELYKSWPGDRTIPHSSRRTRNSC